jgi:putative membrane protein
MLWSLLLRIIAAIVGLFLADKWVPGVDFTGPLFIVPANEAKIHEFFGTLVFVGIVLGILNSVAKPILDKITLPLRIITLNLFSVVVAALMVWATDVVFRELVISGIIPLLWTTLLTWGIGFVLLKWLPSDKK